MQACPTCGSSRVHRSRARSRIETMRKWFSSHRLHRCDDCGWRGLGPASAMPVEQPPPGANPAPLDLSALDGDLRLTPDPTRQR